jgi:phosphomannomutase
MTSAGTIAGAASGPHRLDPTILREYDMRGIVGKTLDEGDARAIGRAFGTMVRAAGGTRVATGYDGRLSSPALEDALATGLAASGLSVLRVGLGPTPMLYYASHALDADGAVMITGSHNPPDYNGFKMMLSGGPFYGEQIQELGRIAAKGEFAEGPGTREDRPLFDEYVARLVGDFAGGRELRVAWDAGNGAAGPATAALAAALPGEHTVLYADIDGTFPNHHPDPTLPETLESLRGAIEAKGCEIGIAFDGDGDRIGVLDGRGRILWGDQLLMLLAADLLKRRPGATVIADVKASQALFDRVAALGGVPLMWRTGHSLIKAKMAETGAPLAGEMSGHIFIADGYYGYDDALYAAVRLLDILARSELDLAALRDALPEFVNTPELRFDCAEERKFGVVDRVKAYVAARGYEASLIDGVRVRTADGWWLLRASNTQAALVARCEASDEAGLVRLKAALGAALEAAGMDAPDF